MNRNPQQIITSVATQDSFVSLLDANSIEYLGHPPRLGIGGSAGEIVDVLKAIVTASVVPSLAAVVVQWLKARSSRKVVLQTRTGDLIQIEGNSLEETTRLLDSAASLRVVDELPNDKCQETPPVK